MPIPEPFAEGLPDLVVSGVFRADLENNTVTSITSTFLGTRRPRAKVGGPAQGGSFAAPFYRK